MTWWEKLLEFLRSLFERPPVVPPPPGPTGPTAVTGPTAATAPTAATGPVVVPLKPVTADTPFRQTPAISSTKIKKILEDEDSPMASEFAQIHTAVKGRALPIAQSWRESRYGKDPSALRNHNPLGLLWYLGSPISQFETITVSSGVIQLLSFESWAAAFAEWARRVDSPTYKGGVYMPALITMEQFIVTYVGGPGCWTSRGATCANGETWASTHEYLGDTMARINRYMGITPPGPTGATGPAVPGWTSHVLAGSTQRLVLPSDIRFRTVLTPKGPNRSGRPLSWTGTTQHETGNERTGANAQMHSAWQDAGTPGHPDGLIGVHFYLDDEEIIQKIPVNEQGVHSGDWRNQQHTSVERCVDTGSNFARSERAAVYLQAGLLRILGKDAVSSLYPHRTKPGPGCPVYIGQDWHGFERAVDRAIAEGK